MRTQHHDFVFFIAARNIGNHIHRCLRILIFKTRIDLHLQLDRLLFFQQTVQPVIGFTRQHQRRNLRRFTHLVRTTTLYKYGTVFAARYMQGCDHFFCTQKALQFFLELLLLLNGLRISTTRRSWFQLHFLQFFQLLTAVAFGITGQMWFETDRFIQQYQCLTELALPLLQIFFAAESGDHRTATLHTLGTRRPGFRNRQQIERHRAQHTQAGMLIGPAQSERRKALGMHILQTPGT